MKRFVKFTILTIVAATICACSEDPVPSSENITNLLWASDSSANSMLFTMLDNGKTLTPQSTYTSWQEDLNQLGKYVLNSHGAKLNFLAKFNDKNETILLLGDNEEKAISYSAIPLQIITAGNRYQLQSWRYANNFESPTEQVYIFFDYENQIRGFAGVNNFFGSYQLTGYVELKVGQLATTRRGGKFLDFEQAFIKELSENVSYYLLIGDILYLYDSSANVIMILQKS